MDIEGQGIAHSLIFPFLTPTPTPTPTHPEGISPLRVQRGKRWDEEDRAKQKGNLTQGQKSSSILITSHESQITVEQSETQHKGAKAQRGKEVFCFQCSVF